MRVKSYEHTLPGRERAIHVTSLLYHPGEDRLYLGLTDMDNDLLYKFDPADSSFTTCDFRRIADEFDVKIHRSLVLDEDGSIIGATAGLHGIPDRHRAGGGKVFRYRPSDNSLDIIARPVEEEYIQSILHDSGRQKVYGFTYPVGRFFVLDLETGKSRSQFIDSYPHLSAMDDDGCVWATWGQGNQLFKYDPERDEIDWHRTGLPRLAVSHLTSSPSDPGQVDCMINGGDGMIYIGSVSGGLFRLDPASIDVHYLGKPLTGLRMAAMTLGPDGLIYAIGGMEGGTRLISYDREADHFDVLGPIRDGDGMCPYITHHVVMSDSTTFYSGETDSPGRSGFLWETVLD